MSEVLARIRVRETHGIRRFLYPLTAYVSLPAGTDTSSLQLAPLDGAPVPLQVTLWHTGQYRVDFAVSMAPLQEDIELILRQGGPQAEVPDPLHLVQLEDGKLQSRQERFSVTLGSTGEFSDVIYDGVEHLLKLPVAVENGTAFRRPNPEDWNYKRGLRTIEQAERMPLEAVQEHMGGGPLSAWYTTQGVYADGCKATIHSEITACKSWVMLNYCLEQANPSERVLLNLPLDGDFSRDSTVTIFDTGIDGIYGQTNYWGASLTWFAPSKEGEPVRWEVEQNYLSQGDSNASRLDYVGTVSKQKFSQQLWFHMADANKARGNKAIAVAITKMPTTWQKLEISIRKTIFIKVTLSEKVVEPMDLGICYHFLNNVPAIAAATNPQSILLPPTVEVLPVW